MCPQSLLSVTLLQFYDQQQYVCAQQIYACAQSLKSVCARTRAQLIGNTACGASLPLTGLYNGKLYWQHCVPTPAIELTVY